MFLRCKSLYCKRNTIQQVIHSELIYKIHPDEFDDFDDQVRSQIINLIQEK